MSTPTGHKPSKPSRWMLKFAGIVFAFLLGGIYLVFWASNTSSMASERAVIIPRGSSFKAALDSLESSGVIRIRWTLDLAGRLMSRTKEIKTGKYLFPRGLSNSELLADLVEGTSRVLITVPIPEGWRLERTALQFGRLLGADPQRFIELCEQRSFRQNLGIEAPSLEGYLMPDTYRFLWETPEEEIIARMVKGFKDFYVDSLQRRQHEMRLTLEEVLTLASIVEAEAMLDQERPTIAGVYLNRLKKRMRLEADPTVQYAIPDGPRRLKYSDLRFNSPYNTYVHYGLPPGPINNPGRKSILAVLYPESHSYLYFVANGAGGHIFSRTYSEHQRAVQSYRKMRREAAKASDS